MSAGFGTALFILGLGAGIANILDDPRNAYIEEVEFVAPDGLRLKPLGFEDVDVLKKQVVDEKG